MTITMNETQAQRDAERIREHAPKLLAALRFYASSCDATGTTPCGYEGNLCCKVAREAIEYATGAHDPDCYPEEKS